MQLLTPVKHLSLLLAGTLAFSSLVKARDIYVTISGMAFSPQRIVAHIGDQVNWINSDGVRHEVFFSKNPSASADEHLSAQVHPGKTLSIVVTKQGDFEYMCRWHGMSGKLHIE